MKKVLWGLGIVAVIGSLIALARIKHGMVSHSSSPTATIKAPRPVAPPIPPSTVVTQSEWQQVSSAREGALQSNSDLALERKQVLDALEAQKAQFDAAMIKADPKVAPIVAKLNQLHGSNGAPAASAQSPKTGSPPTAANAINFTPSEWQELSAARNAALQANPDLVADNKKLMDRMSAIQTELDAAVLKNDPSLAPTMAKIEAQRTRSEIAASSQSSPPAK